MKQQPIAKKHFITDLITAIDEDIQDGNEDHVYKLFNVMLGFTPNQEILTDYITGELNRWNYQKPKHTKA